MAERGAPTSTRSLSAWGMVCLYLETDGWGIGYCRGMGAFSFSCLSQCGGIVCLLNLETVADFGGFGGGGGGRRKGTGEGGHVYSVVSLSVGDCLFIKSRNRSRFQEEL